MCVHGWTVIYFQRLLPASCSPVFLLASCTAWSSSIFFLTEAFSSTSCGLVMSWEDLSSLSSVSAILRVVFSSSSSCRVLLEWDFSWWSSPSVIRWEAISLSSSCCALKQSNDDDKENKISAFNNTATHPKKRLTNCARMPLKMICRACN